MFYSKWDSTADFLVNLSRVETADNSTKVIEEPGRHTKREPAAAKSRASSAFFLTDFLSFAYNFLFLSHQENDSFSLYFCHLPSADGPPRSTFINNDC
jgi:hypothetical protein